jgi:hypothetical protein
MASNTYVPPHLRNKQVTINQPTEDQIDARNTFHRERRHNRPSYQKPYWQIQKEQEELILEENKRQQERGLEDTEDNFPALGGRAVANSASVWTGTRTFSRLAAEWREDEVKRKEEDERQKNLSAYTEFMLPRFRNIHRFGEPEDEFYNQEIPEQQALSEPAKNEWKVVDRRKYRKPKPEFDFNEEDVPPSHENEEDGTVWGGAEEHETCWDER